MKALLLVLLLSGCATTAPVTLKMLPPVDLLQDCPEPLTYTATNGDLAKARTALRKALALCNNDKAALREWSTKE